MVTFRSSPVVDMSVRGDHGSGAAKRLRDRRLRMHWRHEQLTLQMALAAALHHSRDVGPVTYNALRSHRTARAVGARDELYGDDPGTPHLPLPTPTSPVGALQPGTRPDRIATLSGPQERVQRTVQQIVDAVLSLPTLDDPASQMME